MSLLNNSSGTQHTDAIKMAIESISAISAVSKKELTASLAWMKHGTLLIIFRHFILLMSLIILYFYTSLFSFLP